jgi:putative hydrolase of HD superfamily
LYVLLASLIENKKFGGNIDVERAVCRAVFHDINETKIGPIKYEIKKDPEVADQIRSLEREASEEIVTYLSEALQPVFFDFIVNAEDRSTPEGRLVADIDTFDALMFCHRETLFSSSEFFKERYEQLLASLKGSQSESVRWMVEQVEQKTDFYKFLMSVLNLDTIRRWKGRFNLINDNDAVHSQRCAALSVFNCYIEKVKYGVDVNVLRVVAKALCHDLVEERTGDILGPVKHSTPERKKAFEVIEKKYAMMMVKWLPEFLHEDFIDFMVEPKTPDYEGYMISVIDKVDALIKSNIERKYNSMEYELSFRKQLKQIQDSYKNPSVLFFLQYVLHDLEYPFFDEL